MDRGRRPDGGPRRRRLRSSGGHGGGARRQSLPRAVAVPLSGSVRVRRGGGRGGGGSAAARPHRGAVHRRLRARPARVAKGYGFADVEEQVAATADTSYPIASVSKHFTAAAILRLADQGRLGLDDPLSRFFPAARPRIGVLTLRHLLDHTSGLTRGGPAPRAAAVSVLARGGTALGAGAGLGLQQLQLLPARPRDRAGLRPRLRANTSTTRSRRRSD